MNPDDLIHAAPALAKGAGALAAAVPFTAIVKRMLGPAADEVAEMWRDQVRVYRYGRQLKLLEKAERMAQDAGFTPQAVPPKILFPLLEGASFEDDEDLHSLWAALLANAASPGNERVLPSFIEVLKQLSHKEAVYLNAIHERHCTYSAASAAHVEFVISRTALFDIYNETPTGDAEAFNCGRSPAIGHSCHAAHGHHDSHNRAGSISQL